ncbi:MAG TPA: 2-oxoglutarate dehydrogenase complex dihydrolipoyllysine-residue succinyltransferase [Desulfuromonadales bacterium]|nr:2-oxoglutarate dehydrogenase complex dihydrolipoyllysine-residue succinyltransferase [Desulfuromonadales bacterium]
MEIKIPEVGESVREALLAVWFKKNGDTVKRDEPLCEIETDKITLDLNADADGVLSIVVSEGTTVAVGTVIATLEVVEAAPDTAGNSATPAPPAEEHPVPPTSPSVRQELREQSLDAAAVNGSGKGGRITLEDLFSRIEQQSMQPSASRLADVPEPAAAAMEHSPKQPPVPDIRPAAAVPVPPPLSGEASPPRTAGGEERRPMTPLRKRIAERLLAARQQTAMLTTFNEADLSRVAALRSTHREHFIRRHGSPLGLMPFFVKACVEALKEFPAVNARIDGDDIVYHHYYDIGIAVGSEKGLVVPILRGADRLKLFEIDQSIISYAEKIKSNRLAIADLEGGTFTITNGGVYGSMLSTPIINPPQSAVLGMHAIQERPVVRDGQIVIRPMMYLALSYDHRIIDGREAVSFLKRVKEYIEDPEELLLEG